MDKQKLIDALSETSEDRLLLAKIYDKISAGQRKNIPASTGFLSGREQVMAEQLMRRAGMEECHFFGGFEGAERRILCYIPDYYDADDYFLSEDCPVAAIRAHISHYDSLTHRDFLGSLMGQGIKREVLGDILVNKDTCDILVLREMQKYLLDNLFSVGRAKVTVEPIPLSLISPAQQKTKLMNDTVASLRLDSIVSSGFQIGRSKAGAYITGGKTEVNHILTLKPDKPVDEGDKISVRGLGKIILKEIRGNTKKGRIAITVEKLL